MFKHLINEVKLKTKTKLFNNSMWGVISNVLQNVLLTFFFIIIARNYSTKDFGNYTLSNTLYSFLLGFSSLGMGQWFVREYMHTDDKTRLIEKFFKLQLLVGIVFYFLNITFSFSLYNDIEIRKLSLIIGINLIFDNLIYVIKSINLATLEQKKTFIILTIETFLKFLLACLLLIFPINIVLLSFILIFFRIVSLNLFIKFGSSNKTSFSQIISSKLSWHEFRTIIFMNWTFVVISSISIINWRVANIIVSKYLDLKAVADYEITIKLLMVFTIIPIIVTSTIYPMLITAYKESIQKLTDLYHKTFKYLSLYGFFVFTFIWSFSDYFIPMMFGKNFAETSGYAKEMFLVILIFPTIFLQANVIVAIKLEKLDMICNIITLLLNVTLCVLGLYYWKSLTVVNYAVFISFLVFHIIQDVILIKRRITKAKDVFFFYTISIIAFITYTKLSFIISHQYLFIIFWLLAAVAALGYYNWQKKYLQN